MPVPKSNGFRLQPVRRERLADILYGQLVEQISSGAFAEGQRLPSEAEICKAFQASRPVVREALLRLQADGLIYARQGSGSFVKTRPPARITEFAQSSDIAQFLRTFEPRIALESEAARLAALRRTRNQLADIYGALEGLKKAFGAGEPGRDEDYAFHIAVAEASGNAMFAQLLVGTGQALLGTMHMALSLTRVGSDVRRQQVLTEHQQIVDAIAAQDSEAAATYMRYHLIQARGRLTDAHRDA